jgi:succinate dehydrogenase/fumarate reductase flavoprotein subunit
MFRYLMASCGPQPDAEKIRVYCDGSLEHYHWLVEQGVPFKPVFYPHYSGEPPTDDGLVFSGSEQAYPFSELARPAPRGHVPRTEGAAGGLLMQRLLERVARSDARVLGDSRCSALVRDPSGAVVGALARIDGREQAVRARRGVVLTTGGFINDRAMLERYAPLLRRCRFRVGSEGDDGSGIRMGMAAGGAAIHMEMGSVSLPIHPPKQLSKGILVNGQGQRFINEDAYFGRLGEYALLRADGRAHLILDDACFVRPEVPREIAGVGETPEELEAELGLPPGSLASTLELYNRHAALGEDPLFHKAPPFLAPLVHPPLAALDCTTENSLYAVFTLGGLHTNVEGEVLDPDGRAIPGLLAAGRSSAGLSAPGYSSGISLGDATFFGRRAGRRAAGSGSGGDRA